MDRIGIRAESGGSKCTRREFLGSATLGTLGLGLAGGTAVGSMRERRSVILLMLVGGPSQLDTFDPKPDAPAEVRGPFGSIATSVPGIRVGEHLPRISRRMDKLTLIRSLHHDAAPIHETGQQLIQAGRLSREGVDSPHVGSVAAQYFGAENGVPPFVILPGPIRDTGVRISHGQSAGALGERFGPFFLDQDPALASYQPGAASQRARNLIEPAARPAGGTRVSAATPDAKSRRAFDISAESQRIRDVYGMTTFGQSCLLARRLVESGVRFVTVNMYDTVFRRVSWDCHGSGPFSTLDDYARDVLPTFDQAFSALIDDLAHRGLLDSTLVVATGEFGRTPRLNTAGGRDHWPAVWSALLAGGGMRGGQVLGSSDRLAAEPADRPVSPMELVGTMAHALELDLGGSEPMPGRANPSLTMMPPIYEVFA